MSDEIVLHKDPKRPIKIFAISKVDYRSDSQEPEKHITGNSHIEARLPRKIFKFKTFLQSLTEDEREELNFNGKFIFSILKDEF